MKLVRSASVALLFIAVLPLLGATYTTNSPSTTNNDDSCDISLLPAATLLLPYFEVDLASGNGFGETTIATITNTSEAPQAVRMTLWTDFAYPVLTFHVYLTGYDVQSINFFDIIRRGQITPDRGTGSDVSNVGRLSGTPPGTDNDNPRLNEASCVRLPVQLPQVYTTRMQDAFTKGSVPTIGSAQGCQTIGGVHANAIGYATFDVVNACDVTMPHEASYWTDDVNFDNVLIGDYIQVNGSQDFAQINPLVHIRATPEGGAYTPTSPTNLRRTFYSRLQAAGAPTADRRQPLPSTFAARWIAGGATGFETFLKVWREGRTGATGECTAYGANALLTTTEIVRFDEDENPETFAPAQHPIIRTTALLSVMEGRDEFPPNSTGSVAGWMYLNLDDFENDTTARQNWVVVSMRAESRFSGDMDAQALGNGCSAPTRETKAVGGQNPIGPAPNTTP